MESLRGRKVKGKGEKKDKIREKGRRGVERKIIRIKTVMGDLSFQDIYLRPKRKI